MIFFFKQIPLVFFDILQYNKYAVETFQREGGENMHYLINLIVSVMANVISYYIRKWLDRDENNS